MVGHERERLHGLGNCNSEDNRFGSVSEAIVAFECEGDGLEPMDESKLALLIRELRESARNVQAAIAALESLEVSRGNLLPRGKRSRGKARVLDSGFASGGQDEHRAKAADAS